MDFEGSFFDTSKFTQTNKILGQGTFGTVYVVVRNDDKKEFAAKVIDPKGMLNGNDQLTFLLESQILKKLKHPAIVKFHGINFHSFKKTSKLEPTILTEYIKNSSLFDVLTKERQNNCPKDWNATKKYICLLGIADAMRYLHENRVIHRDLKSLNVLLDDDFYPKVCDFGLSRCFSNELSNHVTLTGFVGSPLYMAPEIIAGKEMYGCAVDVYAFAMVAYEITTGMIPWSYETEELTPYIFFDKVLKGERPKFNNKPTEKMIELIKRCWSMNSYDRPTFGEIFQLLSSDFSYFNENLNEDEINAYINILNEANENKISRYITNDRLSNLLIDIDDLQIGEEISRGSIGKFCKAVMPEKDGQSAKEYTVKIIIAKKNLSMQKRFIESIEIQSPLHHIAILPLTGFSLPSDTNKYYSIITEFPHNGSLDKLITNVKKGHTLDNWETIKAINIFGIAAGMAYIHQNDILLGDLRPESVLLDKNNYPKIGGFVNAFFLKNGTKCHDDNWTKGIPIYMAPELVAEERLPFSNKIDVYSFSIVLYRLLTLKIPYEEKKYKGIFKFTIDVSKGVRPEINDGEINQHFVELINSCWCPDPDKRPSFMNIVQKLLKEKSSYFNMDLVNEDEFDKYAKSAIKDLSFW